MYCCLGPLKEGFKKGCRPFIGLDGCFLKGPFPGQLLCAVGIDANNGMITTRANLNREQLDFYTLTIQASDSGAVQGRKHSQTTVAIRVLDDNDNYNDNLTKTITENKNLLK